MRPGRIAVVAAVVLTTIGARPITRVLPTVPVLLPAAVVLSRYAHALERVKQPPAVSFDYAVEQLGLRNMEQTHRVYRSGRSERDETLIVDGYTLRAPSIRIIANRNNRYDIAAVAPRPTAYRFAFTGAITNGSGIVYVFHTAAIGNPAFSVTEVEIDGAQFLPRTIRFKLEGGDAHGSGALTYQAYGGFWVVRDAIVNAHVSRGATAHEHIAWSDYAFPPSLPASTFEAPKAMTTETTEPDVLPTPEPPAGP